MAYRVTYRQLEVARLIAQGLTYEEIGARLGVSARTAKAHGDTLRWRLGVTRKRHIPAALRNLGYDI